MLTLSPAFVDGCDPISFTVAIHSVESDTAKAIKPSTLKSSYGISQAQLLESEDDSDVIVVEPWISENDEEAEAEREYAMEMARQSTQIQVVASSDDMDEEDLAAPASDPLDSSPHPDDDQMSDVEESLPMGQGRPSSELGDAANHHETALAEDSDEDEEEEDEVEEDDYAEEEPDEFDEEYPAAYGEEDVDEDVFPNVDKDLDAIFWPPPPAARYSQRAHLVRPSAPFYPSLPQPTASRSVPTSLFTGPDDAQRARAQPMALRKAKSGRHGFESHFDIFDKSLGLRTDEEVMEIMMELNESPLPSPPQSEASDAAVRSDRSEDDDEEEEDGEEEDAAGGGQWVGDSPPLSDAESVESIEEVSDDEGSQEVDGHDSVPRFVQLPSPELFADAESEIRSLIARRAAAVVSIEKQDSKKRPRVEEEEAVAKVLPYNASFEFTDSPSERTTLVDAPVKMDASTSTHSVVTASTHIVPLDSTADKISSIPSDAYPSPPKRRRVNYKQIVLSSTVGFVAGTVACFCALGALGDI